MKTIAIVLALSISAGSAVLASGSGPSAPPRPPKKAPMAPKPAESMDSAKYELGKSVFTRKAKLTDNMAAMAMQQEKLTMLAGKSGKEGKTLPTLAGKLSNGQLMALEYYVAQRFTK